MTQADLTISPDNVIDQSGIGPGISGTRALISGFRAAAHKAAETDDAVLLKMPGFHPHIQVIGLLTDQGLGDLLVKTYMLLNPASGGVSSIHMATLMCLGRDLRSDKEDSLRAERLMGIVNPHA